MIHHSQAVTKPERAANDRSAARQSFATRRAAARAVLGRRGFTGRDERLEHHAAEHIAELLHRIPGLLRITGEANLTILDLMKLARQRGEGCPGLAAPEPDDPAGSAGNNPSGGNDQATCAG